MNLEKGNLLYRGKAKDIYQTDQQEQVIVKFRDDITAGVGKEVMGLKGYYNSLISAKLFTILENADKNTIH